MTDLHVPPRTEPTTLPAPMPGLVGDRAPMPPPPLRVPAVTPSSLPPLNGAPIVPPMPRFSLDDIDDAAATSDNAIVELAGHPVDSNADQAPVQEADPACAPIVEAAPGIALVDADAPPFVATPPMDTTVVDAIPSASPSEPLGSPPAVAMVMPSLPSVAAAPSPSNMPGVPVSHHPTQRGVPMTSLAAAMIESTARPLNTGRGFGRTMVRTIFGVVLVGALGAGAHLGYDWWEQRDAVGVGGVAVDGSDLTSWPQVDPPAIRYTDSVTTFRDSTGVRTLTAHREIASSRTQAMVQSTDVAGTDLGTVEVDYRGEQSFIRTTPESPWVLTSQEDALAQIGDTWTEDVFTVTEVFPAAAVPYMTVLESVERVLPVRPLVPAAAPNVPVETPMAISTDPTSMVWQYRVIVDVESFRANETVAHQEWTRRLGRNAVSRIEAWVDATGIVRQIAVEIDGTVVTHTLMGGAANSTRFDGNPLVGTEPPAAAPAPVVVPAPVEAGE